MVVGYLGIFEIDGNNLFDWLIFIGIDVVLDGLGWVVVGNYVVWYGCMFFCCMFVLLGVWGFMEW